MSSENTPLLREIQGTISAIDLLAERPDQGSNFLAFVNVVCVVAGAGTLGLPYALKLGGWVGIAVLIVSLFSAIYTAILLVRCLYYNGKYRLDSYQEVGRHAFGKPGLIIVWIFHTSFIIGVPVMYMILAGTEFKELVGIDSITTRSWIWISAAIIAVPFVAVKTLKDVAITSSIGALATVVLVAIVIRGSILDLDNPEYENVAHSGVILANLPSTIASISFCFSGNIVHMHVEQSMRYPRSWNRVVATAFMACTVLYLATAIPGYWTYGDKAESPILNNLPKDLITNTGTIFIIAHVLLAGPILLTAFSLEIERLINITESRHGKIKERIYRTILRLGIIAFCGSIACSVPYFGDFLSLLGALFNCSLIYVLPIIFYWRLVGWKQMKSYELLWCVFVLTVGIFSSFIGTIDAIKALKRDFESDPNN